MNKCTRENNGAAGVHWHWWYVLRVMLLAGVFAIGPCLFAATRPNIVIITADNLGYRDVGCYGNTEIKTPCLDRLSGQGVRCLDFYTASPTCTVSRASLLTGRYPQRHKLTHQLPGIKGNYGVGLRQSEVLLPACLRQAGYRTACFGKWNIGFAEGSRPTERGFDEFFGHVSGNIDYWTHVYNGKPDLYRGTVAVDVDGYSTDLFADQACRFMREHAKERFFVYLPFNAPHYPNPRNKRPGRPCIWQAPPYAFDAYGLSAQTEDPKKRYQAVVTALDRAIGRVLAELEQLKLSRQTLVIFFSDNGAFMLPKRGLEVASNKPLRNGGVTLWEGGIRVPCIVRWPSVIPPSSICRQPLLSCDCFAMSVKAAGGHCPKNHVIDGLDPTAALAGQADSPHKCLCFEYGKYAAIRSGQFKLIRTAPDRPWMLFNLAEDIAESNDVAGEHPAVVRRLEHRFQQWQREMAQ